MGFVTWWVIKGAEAFYVCYHVQLYFELWIYGRRYLAYFSRLHLDHDRLFFRLYCLYQASYSIIHFSLVYYNYPIPSEQLYLFLTYYIRALHDVMLFVSQIYYLFVKIQKIRYLQGYFNQNQMRLERLHRKAVGLLKDMDRFNRLSSRLHLWSQSLSYLIVCIIILYNVLYRFNNQYSLLLLIFIVNVFAIYILIYSANYVMSDRYRTLRSQLVAKACRLKRSKRAAYKIRIDNLLTGGDLHRQMSLWILRLRPMTLDMFGTMINCSFILAIMLFQTDTM